MELDVWDGVDGKNALYGWDGLLGMRCMEWDDWDGMIGMNVWNWMYGMEWMGRMHGMDVMGCLG